MNGTPTAPELLEAARNGDNRACEQVLEENNGLIWSIVRRHYGRPVSTGLPGISQGGAGV